MLSQVPIIIEDDIGEMVAASSPIELGDQMEISSAISAAEPETMVAFADNGSEEANDLPLHQANSSHTLNDTEEAMKKVRAPTTLV